MTIYELGIQTNRTNPKPDKVGQRCWSEILWQTIFWEGALVDVYQHSREDLFQLRLQHELKRESGLVTFNPHQEKKRDCSYYTFSLCSETKEKVEKAGQDLLRMFPDIIVSITVSQLAD